jgi:ribonuclease P protein component
MIAKKFRLRRWRAQMILKKGNSKHIGKFIVKYLPNNKPFHRWALVVSRKFSKLATERNRKRRQIYESIRLNRKNKKSEAENYYDVVLIPKKNVINSGYENIYENISDIISYLESK